MKKFMWVLVFFGLSSLVAGTALAGHTDRMCYDFDARVSRVKERLAWHEKTLYDDLAGLRQDKAITGGNRRLAQADAKLSMAIRICEDTLREVQILKERMPREVECGDRHSRVRRQIDAEVVALNDVEGKDSQPQQCHQPVPFLEVRGCRHYAKHREVRLPRLAPAVPGKRLDYDPEPGSWSKKPGVTVPHLALELYQRI